MPAALAERLRTRIERDGPLPVADFVDAALYDEYDGFYASGGRAGRRGDFLTAPEVGPLFGAVISNAVDTWWTEVGRPDRFVVAEHGAGPGTLARTVTVAGGACLGAGALEWVMVERADAQRVSHPEGPHLRSVADAGPGEPVDVVLANELLDNLPFGIAHRVGDGWCERRVAAADGRFTLVDGPAIAAPAGADAAPVGAELPILDCAVAWLETQREAHPGARLVILDYAAPTSELLARSGEWLRAYRDHGRVLDWLADPGSCDITIDLPLEQLDLLGGERTSQTEFLRRHGIDALVAEGARVWAERAGVGDLAALRARSRGVEAEALLDLDGMGAFTVLEWEAAPSADSERTK